MMYARERRVRRLRRWGVVCGVLLGAAWPAMAEEGETGYTLTLVCEGQGAIEPPAGTYPYAPGETATITANLLNGGGAFEGWTGDIAEEEAAASPIHLLMDRDRVVTAKFIPGDWVLTVMDIAGGGSGTLTPGPGIYAYLDGRAARVEMTPDGGTFWGGWTGDMVSFEYALTLDMDADKMVTPHLAVSGYGLEVNVEGNGAVRPFQGAAALMADASFTLEAIPEDAGWKFDHWEGDVPAGADASSATLDIIMDKARALTALFAESDKTLTIVIEGTGTTTPPGAPAPGTPYVYPHGTTAEVEAALGRDGWAFSHWTGDIEESGLEGRRLTLAMTRDRTVTAHYTAAEHVLTLVSHGNGTTVPPPGNYGFAADDSVDVTPLRLAGGDAFSHWNGDLPEGAVPEQERQSVLMNQNRAITAVFETGDWKLTITEASGGGAAILSPGPGEYAYLAGQTASFEARPAAGSYWGGWSGSVETLDFSAAAFMDNDKAVTPICATSGHILDLSVTGKGAAGQYEGVHGFVENAELTLEAEPADSEWLFDGWSGDVPEDAPAQSPSLAVRMDRPRTIVANFVARPMNTLTMVISGTGATTPAGAAAPGIQHRYETGSVVDVSAALGTDGWAFKGWAGDIGGNAASALSLRLTMDQDRTITARYLPAVYTLIITAEGNGSTWPSPGVYGFLSGVPIVLEAVRLDGGGAFDRWAGDLPAGADVLADAQRIIMSEDRTITASFQSGDYTLHVGAITGGGAGVCHPPAGAYAYLNGREAHLSIEPAEGMFWGGWTGAFVSFAYALTISMDGDKTLTPVIGTSGYSLEVSVTGKGEVAPFTGTRDIMAGALAPLDAVESESGWVFRRWTGDVPEGADPVAPRLWVPMDRERRLQAVFTEPDRLLTMIISGVGNTDPPGATDAGLQYVYAARSQAAVEAHFGTDGWAFSHWTGDIGTNDTEMNRMTLTMDKDRVVTAHYVPAEQTLAITRVGSGYLWPPPGVYGCMHGRRFALEADILNGGDAFDRWAGDLMEEADATSSIQEIVMDQDRALTAAFISGDWSLIVHPVAGPGTGITVPGPGVYRYLEGQTARVKAKVDTGMYWGGWTGDISGYDYSLAIAMDGDKEITPNIATQGHHLSLSTNDYWLGNPSPTGLQGYVAGANPIIRAIPWYMGFFSFWQGDLPAQVDPHSPEIEVTMDQDRIIRAIFGQKDWYLYLQCQGMGTTSPRPQMHWHMNGDRVTLQAFPARGHEFLQWSGLYAGEGSPESPEIVLQISENRIITAIFVPGSLVVPEVSGLSLQAATNRLIEYSLRLGAVSEAYSDIFEEGLVCDQFPGPGSFAAFAESVDVVVSLGPPPIEEGEGSPEGAEGEGGSEGAEGEGGPEGAEGEGGPEGAEGEGEGITEGEGEGGVFLRPVHSADMDGDLTITLSELLRVIQFFNALGYCCADALEPTEDGYQPGLCYNRTQFPHSGDYRSYYWQFDIYEILRMVQLFNVGHYYYCPDLGTEDTFCPGWPAP